MSEHTVELVKYAIQLPDSDLADDFVGDRNNAYLWTLPNGKQVYVWDDADDARKCFERIATEVEFHGCRELFQQHATVVRIDIRTVHRMDIWPASKVVDEPIAEAEVADATALRTWTTAGESPYDVTFRSNDPAHAENPIRWTRSGTHGYFCETFAEVDRIVSEDDINARFTGFVEVLS